MQTETDTPKPETKLKEKSGEGCSGATCSRLRRTLSNVLLALGNGAACSQDASLEFMEMIPREVELVRQKWERDYFRELANARKAEGEAERLRNAIRSFVTDFERVDWGWDGDCGSKGLVDALFESITANA